MLPIALKVVWFCLSLSGIVVCWVVLYTFSRAIGCCWVSVLYSIFATLLQGIFCLGMIYDMNPYQMPRVFCIAQTFLIYYSAWSLTGVGVAFTYATSRAVLWPSPAECSPVATLAWKNKYYIPILIFPLCCLSISVPVLLRVNAIQPSNDLHCDASNPEWGRFLGYAGLPLIPTIPCFFLSVLTARRMIQLHRDNQHTHFSFRNPTSQLQDHSRIEPSHGRNSEKIDSPDLSQVNTALAPADPEMVHSPQPKGTRADAALRNGATSSPATTLSEVSCSHRRIETWEIDETIEEDDELDTQRPMEDVTLPSMAHIPPRPRPTLVPAIWRLILFQIVFFVIQWLAALSTVIDVARRRPTPTPFGTQHIALVLAGWGPAIVFGHLPAVRRRLMFWK